MTNLYLTSTAADAGVTAGSGTKWAVSTTPGSSATHLNKNSVAGPTAPLQATDGAAGADGTVVSWYTPPLHGVTIAGAISCLVWDRENATANNVAPTIRIERTDGDGNVQSTIVAETTSHGASEMGTTAGGASDTISVSAGNVTDTALSDGDRLRVTLWIDDAAGQGGTGNMAAGGRGEFWVNGPNGSQGQAQLAFTESVIPQASPYVEWAESARNNTTPKTASITCTTGDLLVVTAGGDQFGAANDITAVTPTTTAGSTGAWSTIDEDLSGANVNWIGSYQATVTADGSTTVQIALTRSGGTPGTWHFTVYRIKAGTFSGIGDSPTSFTASSTQVVSVPVDDHSAVMYLSVDWDSGSVGTPTPGGANVIENSTGSDNTENTLLWLDQPAGTRNYGTTGANGGAIRCLAVEVLPAAGGSTQPISLSGEVAPAGGLIRQPQKLPAGTTTPVGAVAKQTQRSLAGAVTPVGAALKLLSRVVGGATTPTGVVTSVRIRLLAIAGAITPTGLLTRQPAKHPAGSVTPTGSMAKQAAKTAVGTATPTGALSSIRTRIVALVGAITPSGIAARQANKSAAGSTTPTGAVARSTGRRLLGSITPTGALSSTRTRLLALAGVLAPAGTLVRRVGKALAGTTTPTGATTKQIAHTLSGQTTPAGGLLKLLGRLLGGTTEPSGSVGMPAGEGPEQSAVFRSGGQVRGLWGSGGVPQTAWRGRHETGQVWRAPQEVRSTWEVGE